MTTTIRTAEAHGTAEATTILGNNLFGGLTTTTRTAGAHGTAEATTIPGNNLIAWTHGFFVDFEHRGKGAGKSLKLEQMLDLINLNYRFLLCSVSADNQAQQAILRGLGWSRLADFGNPRDGGQTQIWGCDLAIMADAMRRVEDRHRAVLDGLTELEQELGMGYETCETASREGGQ